MITFPVYRSLILPSNTNDTPVCSTAPDHGKPTTDVDIVDRVVFNIKGSTYNDSCQTHLKNIRTFLSQDKEIYLSLEFDHDNISDKNAIKVLSNSLHLGYIPKERIPRESNQIIKRKYN